MKNEKNKTPQSCNIDVVSKQSMLLSALKEIMETTAEQETYEIAEHAINQSGL